MDAISDYDDMENELDKTSITVNTSNFSDKDFEEFVNCLEGARESMYKKQNSRKQKLKNYCVKVPTPNSNSISNSSGQSAPKTRRKSLKKSPESVENLSENFDKKCDEIKCDISQMFSYFDEDINVDLEEEPKEQLLDITPDSPERDCYKDFREKFIRNRAKMRQLEEQAQFKPPPPIQHNTHKPIICGVVKKKACVSTTTTTSRKNSLNKNQVDKIINEFNRVKINYYSKDNYVEFTNVDYFYADSDNDTTRDSIGRGARGFDALKEKFNESEGTAFKYQKNDLGLKSKHHSLPQSFETKLLNSHRPNLITNRVTILEKVENVYHKLDEQISAEIPRDIVKEKVALFNKIDSNPGSFRKMHLIEPKKFCSLAEKSPFSAERFSFGGQANKMEDQFVFKKPAEKVTDKKFLMEPRNSLDIPQKRRILDQPRNSLDSPRSRKTSDIPESRIIALSAVSPLTPSRIPVYTANLSVNLQVSKKPQTQEQKIVHRISRPCRGSCESVHSVGKSPVPKRSAEVRKVPIKFVDKRSGIRTPQSRPTTPQSRPVTPQFRPATPQSRPGTPKSNIPKPMSRPTTPQSRPATPQDRAGPSKFVRPATPKLPAKKYRKQVDPQVQNPQAGSSMEARNSQAGIPSKTRKTQMESQKMPPDVFKLQPEILQPQSTKPEEIFIFGSSDEGEDIKFHAPRMKLGNSLSVCPTEPLVIVNNHEVSKSAPAKVEFPEGRKSSSPNKVEELLQKVLVVSQSLEDINKLEQEIFAKPNLGSISKQPSILEEKEHLETEKITENLMDLKRRLERPISDPVNIPHPMKLEDILKRMEEVCIEAGRLPKRQDNPLNASQTPDLIPQSETGHFLGVTVPPVNSEGPTKASSNFCAIKSSEFAQQNQKNLEVNQERGDRPGKRYLDGTRVRKEKNVRFSEDVPASPDYEDTVLLEDGDSFGFLDELDLGHEKILGQAVQVLDAESEMYWESGKTVDFDKFMEPEEFVGTTKRKTNKNITSQNKNLNKCFIKDINESLLEECEKNGERSLNEKSFLEEDEKSGTDSAFWPLSSTWNGEGELNTILSSVRVNNVDLLLNLEDIMSSFQMSLLQIINSLIRDDAFVLKDSPSSSMLIIETWPSIQFFNQTYLNDPTQAFEVDSIDLDTVDSDITLQLHLKKIDKRTDAVDYVKIDVLFAAKYLNDSIKNGRRFFDGSAKGEKETFSIFITSFFEPPENELQKSSTAALSEHQLRVQASLQKLNIPDWYKQYTGNTPYYKGQADSTNLLKKRNSDVGRWQGLNSKTTSLSSLGSNRSDRSPILLSPSAHSHHGQTGFSRWSTSHLNSNQTSPSVSTRSSFVRNTNYNSSGHSATIGGYTSTSSQQGGAIRSSFRQPYLGWRSQEKLSQPRTPHERLASSLLTQKQVEEQKQRELEQPMATQEIQTSIKEVTSAIVHYVNDQNRSSRSRSVSPSTRCWLESSFVGTKPLESPQTPIIDNSFTQPPQKSIIIGPMSTSDSIRINGVAPQTSSQTVFPPTYSYLERSNSATTLEDVLSSLLGLPTTDSHSEKKFSTEDLANQQIYKGIPAQSTKTFASFSADPNKKSPTSLTVELPQLRRLSEGDIQKRKQQEQQEPVQQPSNPKPIQASQQPQQQQQTQQQQQQQNRRVSLDSSETTRSSEMLKCRYPKCEVTATPSEAKKTFKSCHNCNFSYCSRECRRAHWEKHRRFCLHSRVSAICRQVLSSCKDDPDTLKHLSLLARKGFLMQGRGVVRLLFRSPENADMFIKQGFQCLGEVNYVRWPDLMPAEMGPELYSELLRLSTEYKTDSKMLVYVAICVVSEAPGTATAPVKWERQLVSRCAKLKLCKSILNDKTLFNAAGTSPASSIMVKKEFDTDVLILTFNATDKFTQKSREIIMTNVLQILHQKGINLRKHYPEVFQRLNSYVEGLSDRFLPVTIHPRDNNTGRAFVCIIMPVSGESEKIKLPPKQDGGDYVQTIDVGIENLYMEDDVNNDIFTEGTKF